MFAFRARRGLLVSGMVGLVFLAVALTTSFTPASTLATDGQRVGTLGTWQFQYQTPQADADGSYILTYDYPRSSTSDLEVAVAAMNQQAAAYARAGSPFRATIVFDRPLPINRFIALAEQNGLQPTNNVIRAIDPAMGGVIKMTAPPEYEHDARGGVLVGKLKQGGKALDAAGFAEFTKNRPSLRVLGVISTDVTLDQASYEKLQATSEVYAVDVMQHLLAEQFLKEHPDVLAEKLQIQWSILYPAMEETGIAPDPKRQ